MYPSSQQSLVGLRHHEVIPPNPLPPRCLHTSSVDDQILETVFRPASSAVSASSPLRPFHFRYYKSFFHLSLWPDPAHPSRDQGQIRILHLPSPAYWAADTGRISTLLHRRCLTISNVEFLARIFCFDGIAFLSITSNIATSG